MPLPPPARSYPSADLCAAHVSSKMTTESEVDAHLETVMASRGAWQQLDNKGKAALLRESFDILIRHMHAFAAEGVQVRGSHGSGLGEELCAHPLLATCSRCRVRDGRRSVPLCDGLQPYGYPDGMPLSTACCFVVLSTLW